MGGRCSHSRTPDRAEVIGFSILSFLAPALAGALEAQCNPFFESLCFAHLARAALRADSVRSFLVSFRAVAFPPLRPNLAKYWRISSLVGILLEIIIIRRGCAT